MFELLIRISKQIIEKQGYDNNKLLYLVYLKNDELEIALTSEEKMFVNNKLIEDKKELEHYSEILLENIFINMVHV